MKNSPHPTIVRRHPASFVKDFRRVACCECGNFCFWLGEAVRVECAEGRFEILHACLPCVRNRASRAELREEVKAA